MSGANEIYAFAPSQSELDYFAEQAREEAERQQREAGGRIKLAARFAADSNAASRCARILATLASDSSCYWDANDVVRERSRRNRDNLDTVTVALDLEVMCEAGLLEVECRDNGEEDAPPTESWGVYAVNNDDLDQILMLGTERWLAGKLRTAPMPPKDEPR